MHFIWSWKNINLLSSVTPYCLYAFDVYMNPQLINMLEGNEHYFGDINEIVYCKDFTFFICFQHEFKIQHL